MERLTNKEKEKIIEKKSMQILHFLNLSRKNSNIMDQMGIILRLYKFTVQNIYPENDIKLENKTGTREEEYLNELYKGVVCNSGAPVTNVIFFKHLLYMKGFESDIVLTKTKRGEPHLANLVKIGNERFYFDPSLERSIYEEQGQNHDELLYCCAALGKDEYSEFYNPIGTLPKKLGTQTLPIPSDVSDESMPRSWIESVTKLIPDLTARDNPEFDKHEEQEKTNAFSRLISKKTTKEEREY